MSSLPPVSSVHILRFLYHELIWATTQGRLYRSLITNHYSLNRALTFAADDLEELVLAPVHVGVDVLVDGADFLELIQQRVERLRADAVDEGDELLALVSLGLVVVDDLLRSEEHTSELQSRAKL